MSRSAISHAALLHSVRYIAERFGLPAGRCPLCWRPVLLTACGWVPQHVRTGGRNGPFCPGSDAEDPLPLDFDGAP